MKESMSITEEKNRNKEFEKKYYLQRNCTEKEFENLNFITSKIDQFIPIIGRLRKKIKSGENLLADSLPFAKEMIFIILIPLISTILQILLFESYVYKELDFTLFIIGISIFFILLLLFLEEIVIYAILTCITYAILDFYSINLNRGLVWIFAIPVVTIAFCWIVYAELKFRLKKGVYYKTRKTKPSKWIETHQIPFSKYLTRTFVIAVSFVMIVGAVLFLIIGSSFEILRRHSNQGVYSSYPEAIANSKAVQKLFIGKTTISNKIGDLSNLKILYIGTSKLKKLPPSIEKLVNVEELYLERNYLESFPLEIISLHSLTHLSLSCNFLKTIPSTIQNLEELKHLDLGHNHLKNVPLEIEKLQALEHLNLSYNELKNLPLSITKIESLQELHIDAELVVNLCKGKDSQEFIPFFYKLGFGLYIYGIDDLSSVNQTVINKTFSQHDYSYRSILKQSEW